jgi:hypothetical protein
LVDQPRQPIELPERREKPERVDEEVIQCAAEKASRNVKPLGFMLD